MLVCCLKAPPCTYIPYKQQNLKPIFEENQGLGGKNKVQESDRAEVLGKPESRAHLLVEGFE